MPATIRMVFETGHARCNVKSWGLERAETVGAYRPATTCNDQKGRRILHIPLMIRLHRGGFSLHRTWEILILKNLRAPQSAQVEIIDWGGTSDELDPETCYHHTLFDVTLATLASSFAKNE